MNSTNVVIFGFHKSVLIWGFLGAAAVCAGLVAGPLTAMYAFSGLAVAAIFLS